VAYLSLYRKYRPQTFDEILGQEHVSTTLANAIAEDRVAHAYLFTGPRGTGKTSTARILAKALNCKEGPTPTPCGVCDACVAIAEGSSLDVIELDAASHSGVDDTRDILAGVPLATAGSRKKVYVIDEVHMLTTPSFNALLKTLEEPPGHVEFILATTEAHKVLSTIQSRTQRFDFRPIPADVLHEHLAFVAKSEKIDIADDALGAIARHADGSARDALSLLDQLSSYGGQVVVADVERVLGGRAEEAFIEMFDAIAGGDTGAVFGSLHVLIAQGADVRRLADGAIAHARHLLLLLTAPDAEDLVEVAAEDRSRLAAQAKRFTPTALLRLLELVATARTDMRESPNHRLLLEVALIRAAQPETDPGALGLLGRIERLERRMGVEGPPPQPARPEAAPAAEGPEPKETAPVTEGAPEPPNTPEGVSFGHIKEAWPATLREVAKRSKRVAAFLHSSRPREYEGENLIVDVQSEFHAGEMAHERNRVLLADALHSVLGVSPRLKFAAAGRPVAATADDAGEPDDVSDHPDPVELVKKGLSAEIVEEGNR
jgi:DNA polymerase III subunit gamma/tau